MDVCYAALCGWPGASQSSIPFASHESSWTGAQQNQHLEGDLATWQRCFQVWEDSTLSTEYSFQRQGFVKSMWNHPDVASGWPCSVSGLSTPNDIVTVHMCCFSYPHQLFAVFLFSGDTKTSIPERMIPDRKKQLKSNRNPSTASKDVNPRPF